MPLEIEAGSTAPRRLPRAMLVTGLSGAGKTTALQALEDLGWETIDNFPIRFLERIAYDEGPDDAALAVGVDARTRGFAPHAIIKLLHRLNASDRVEVSSLFLDCSSHELERRYNETRRRHPLAQGRPIGDAIRAERELLATLRQRADIVIDTTHHSAHDLQNIIRDRFAETTRGAMDIAISSFGFAKGMPPVADLVFDMRFLQNPHWEPELRELTGLDDAVAAYLAASPGFDEAFARLADLIDTLIPYYRTQSRSYLTVAFGCTGGRHRSVYTAERMAAHLRAQGISLNVNHRNLEARLTDAIKGPEQPGAA